MSNSKQMRELGGLIDNLYLAPKNRHHKHHHQDANAKTPSRSRATKSSSARTTINTAGASRGNAENTPLPRGHGAGSGVGAPGTTGTTGTVGTTAGKVGTTAGKAGTTAGKAGTTAGKAPGSTAGKAPGSTAGKAPGSTAGKASASTAGKAPGSPRRSSRATERAPMQPPAEKKRFNTTLSKPSGGSSLTGKRWNLSCFTMGKPIGKGRFGNVYLAREKASMKVLALKIMLKKDLEAAGVYHQVKSEIDIHVNYGSGCPNIVRCYGYFYDEKRIFIVMEYARKGELYRTMKSQPGGRFTEAVAALYIYQLVRALQYLHKLNVIHRDIKPENLLLDKAGNLRLCDFGWSIEMADYDTRQTICGTQDYLAPEMLMERPYTTSVDLWAAGVVTFEFLVGRSPFRSESGGADTLSRIERGFFVFPEEPTVSPDAKDFVNKLLKVEPSDRMTLDEAIEHPWLKQVPVADKASSGRG